MNKNVITYDEITPLIIASNKNDSIVYTAMFKCEDCSNKIVTNNFQPFCINCGGYKQINRVNILSDATDVTALVNVGYCKSCESELNTDDENNLITKNNEIYCPLCSTKTQIKDIAE